MAVAFDAASESALSTSGTSFSWSHTRVGTVRGAVVFVMAYNAGTDLATSEITGVTYGGTALAAVSGGSAVINGSERLMCRAFYLGASVPSSSPATVQVSRTDTGTEMYGVCLTVTAAGDTSTAGVYTLEGTSITQAEQSIDDGSPGSNSVRVAGGAFGHGGIRLDQIPPDINYVTHGASSSWTSTQYLDPGGHVYGVVYETTAGQGARNVGFLTTNADDGATVYFAIREATGGSTYTGTVGLAAAGAVTTGGAVAGGAVNLAPAVKVEYKSAGGTWYEVTTDVLRTPALRIAMGIDGAGPTDRVAGTGTARFALRNDAGSSGGVAGYYSPQHTNCRTGGALGVECRITITDPASGIPYRRFWGWVDRIQPAAGAWGVRPVFVECVDFMDLAARWVVSGLGPQWRVTAREAVEAILAEMPTNPGGTFLGYGSHIFPIVFDTAREERTTALQELQRIALSDCGFVFVAHDGTFKYESHGERIASVTVQASLDDGAIQALEYAAARADVYSVVRCVVQPRTVDPVAATALWSLEAPVLIGAGETIEMLAGFRDPATGDRCGGVDPVELEPWTDYQFTEGPDGGGQELTSAIDVAAAWDAAGARLSIENTGATAGYLVKCQTRARGIYHRAAVTAEAVDATAAAAYGEIVAVIPMPYQGSFEFAQSAAAWLLSVHATAGIRARAVEFLASTPALLTTALQTPISARVSVADTQTGINAAGHLQATELVITPGGLVRMRWEFAPTVNPAAAWVLGVAGKSELDQTAVVAPI